MVNINNYNVVHELTLELLRDGRKELIFDNNTILQIRHNNYYRQRIGSR